MVGQQHARRGRRRRQTSFEFQRLGHDGHFKSRQTKKSRHSIDWNVRAHGQDLSLPYKNNFYDTAVEVAISIRLGGPLQIWDSVNCEKKMKLYDNHALVYAWYKHRKKKSQWQRLRSSTVISVTRCKRSRPLFDRPDVCSTFLRSDTNVAWTTRRGPLPSEWRCRGWPPQQQVVLVTRIRNPVGRIIL